VAVTEPLGQVDDEHRLVAAVRRGDDRAFEVLYARYHRRIAAYALSMVKDHGRAEDVTQEVFVSALRRMRETDRPIAFKPWIYEIARNACIDHFRRSKRAEEVALDGDDSVAGREPSPDAAVLAKQDLDDLCGALGGLSDTHHEILLLRELEGRSYREIGERLGMTRPAVESTLFRARRRLSEEYQELATGASCRRVRDLIATAVARSLGARDSRRLARHASHCTPCRREALAAGLDPAMLTFVPLRRRAAAKISTLPPFPALARLLRGVGGDAGGPLGALSEQLGGGWAKAVAAVAVLVAGAGAGGVGSKIASNANAAPSGDRPALERTASTGPASTARDPWTKDAQGRDGGETRSRRDGRAGGSQRGAGDSARSDGEAGRNASAGDSGGGDRASGDPGSSSSSPSGSGGGSSDRSDAPSSGGGGRSDTVNGVTRTVRDTTDGVRQTVRGTTDGVQETVQGTTNGVDQTVQNVPQGLNQTVQGATQGNLNETVQGVGGTVQGAVDGVGSTVNGATQGAGQTVGNVTNGVNQTLEGATGLPGPGGG
jgi:RNA polymerase sigma factor (sigma-70 family)